MKGLQERQAKNEKTRGLAACRVFVDSGGRASGQGWAQDVDATAARRDAAAAAAAARVVVSSCVNRKCVIEVSCVRPRVKAWPEIGRDGD
jgi:hypothetical protein